MSLARPLPDALVELCADHLRVLGQPVRIRVIEFLDQVDEANVQTMVEILNVGQQNLSKHLRLLHEAGVLRRRRQGREVWYGLSDARTLTLVLELVEQIMHRLEGAGGA